MKASNTENTFKVLFLIGVALYMTACGNSTKQSLDYDFASRAPITTDPTVESPTTGTGTYVATCNFRTNSELGAKLKMFVDKTTNSYRMDMVQVRMTTLPTDFINNTSYIAMWKWLGLTGTGTQTLANEPLRFAVYDSYSGKYLTDWKTTLMWNDVAGNAKALGITSPELFFTRVTLIIKLSNPSDEYGINEYDALKVTSYSSSTKQVTKTLDVLLPPFAANPNDYAKEANGAARSPALQILHPLAALKANNNTSAQYLEMTKEYCF